MDEEEHIPEFMIEDWVNQRREEDDDCDLAQSAAFTHPGIFEEFFHNGERWGISKEDLAQWVGAAWGRWGACLDQHEWRELFDLAGYREDDEPANRPVAPLTLWRGGTPEFRTFWSWTEVRDIAHLYASGRYVQRARDLWLGQTAPDPTERKPG